MAVASLRWEGREAPRELPSLGHFRHPFIAQSRSFSIDKRLPFQGFRPKMGIRPF
jgi:hypothetical protein